MPSSLRANACRVALTVALLGPGGGAEAGCRIGAPIASVLQQQYLDTPAALLSGGPQGTDALRLAVERFAPSGPAAVKAVLSTVAAASPTQQVAIGRGLADAAHLCMTQDSGIVQRIKNAVRSSGSSVVEQSFVATFEDSAGADATKTPSDAVDTHRSATSAARPGLQSLTPDDATGVGKLPNPFGSPDEWR